MSLKSASNLNDSQVKWRLIKRGQLAKRAHLTPEWARRLAESGFRDIESADGEWLHADTEADLSEVDVELERAVRGRAREALSDEALWRGLPQRARRLWALVVAGYSVKHAGRMVGLGAGGAGQRRAEAYRDEILRRIER